MTNQRIWAHYQNERQDAFAASQPRLNFLIRQIAKRAKGKPHVLNIGVGDGYFDRQAQLAGWDIQSVDPDEQAISRLVTAGIRATTAGIEKLPQPTGSMDFVVVSEVLEHLDDQTLHAGLAEVARVLKPGGFMIGTVPHAENLIEQQAICPHCTHVFHRWGHERSFTLATMRQTLSVHFTVEALGRTALVDLRGRGVRGFLKGAFRKALAKIGEPIAVANIWWVAGK